MKKITTFLLWAFAISCLVASYIFAGFYQANLDDFTSIEGLIRGEILIEKDEYGEKDVSLKFYLKNDEIKYTLAGELLQKSDPDIYNLKEGDAVQVWVKKESEKTTVERFLSKVDAVWGLQRKDAAVLLALESALEQRKGPQSLLYMSLFLLMALGAFSLLYKRR